MTLSQITDIIAYELERPNDSNLKTAIQNLVLSARSMLIRQSYQKYKSFPQSAIMSLCLSMEDVNSTECCLIDLGCTLPRTIDIVPMPILISDELNFLYIGDGQNTNSFGYLKPEEVKYIKRRKFSSKKQYYTYINGRIVVYNSPSLEALKLRYVPSNPLEFIAMKDCNGKPCFNIEDVTFIEDVWEDAITKFVIPKLSKTKEGQIMINKDNGKETGAE